MVAIKSHWSRLFEQRLAEFRQSLISDLAVGIAPDFPAYRQVVGRIQGIEDALKIANDVDATLHGEE